MIAYTLWKAWCSLFGCQVEDKEGKIGTGCEDIREVCWQIGRKGRDSTQPQTDNGVERYSQISEEEKGGSCECSSGLKTEM